MTYKSPVRRGEVARLRLETPHSFGAGMAVFASAKGVIQHAIATDSACWEGPLLSVPGIRSYPALQ